MTDCGLGVGMRTVHRPRHDLPSREERMTTKWPYVYFVAWKPLRKMIILVFVFCCFGSVFGNIWPQDPFNWVRLEK